MTDSNPEAHFMEREGQPNFAPEARLRGTARDRTQTSHSGRP